MRYAYTIQPFKVGDRGFFQDREVEVIRVTATQCRVKFVDDGKEHGNAFSNNAKSVGREYSKYGGIYDYLYPDTPENRAYAAEELRERKEREEREAAFYAARAKLACHNIEASRHKTPPSLVFALAKATEQWEAEQPKEPQEHNAA